jgi:hypothetical protein
MLLTKEIEIIINSKHLKLKNIDNEKYSNIKVGDIINIPIEHLSIWSRKIVTVECDVCKKVRDTPYNQYNKSFKIQNYYACCRSCSYEKTKDTKKEKYGDENYNNHLKSLNTKKEKYGDENYNNQQKMKDTTKCRYNDENYRNSRKTKNTKKEKYGDENYYNDEKFKKTCLERFGNEYPMQNEKIREKSKKTCLERYGTDNVMQHPSIFNVQQKSSFQTSLHDQTGLSYQGTYEKDFLDYCFYNNILVKKGKRIKYFYEDKKHYYFSDFYYEPSNLIIEIKSSWTYDIEKELNEIKKLATITSGYNYLFVIDKKYEKFKNMILENKLI